MLNSTARVKGAIRAARFFCGDFPFFAPQKNQKNRGFRGFVCKDCSGFATWTLG
jgi:hypothetical protein